MSATPGPGRRRDRGNLRARVIKSTAWYTGARLCAKLMSWATTVLLARWLVPADYGLFAMALTVIAFLELFQEAGLGTAIIQRQDLRPQQLNAFFWLVGGLSLAMTAVAFGAAEVAAWYYGEPRLVGIVRLLSLAFLFQAAGLVPYNLLTKELDFRQRSIAETAGAAASSVVAFGLAWGGNGVWALVAGNLASAVVRNGGVLLFSGWRPGLDVSFTDMRAIVTFGLNVTGRQAVRSLSHVVNFAIIGRFLGGTALGLYSMAHSIGTNPLHKLSTSVIHQMSLPVFSKVQTDDGVLRRYYLRLSKYLAVITLPVNVGMALVTADMITVVLTPKWAAMVGLVEVFCVGGLCYVMSLPSTSLLTSRGRADRVFRVYLVSSMVVALALLAGTRFGLPGVALAYLATYPMLRVFLLWLGLREIQLDVRTFLENISAPLLATILMGVAVSVVRVAMPNGDAWERLAVCVAAGAVTYVAVVLLADRQFGGDVKDILRTLVAPAGVRKERA